MEHPTGGIDFSLDSGSVFHAKWQRALQPLGSLQSRNGPKVDLINMREDDALEVKVEGKDLALMNTRKYLQADEPIFSLSVPNQLLF